jgi:ATP-binding cassette subfamily B protein
MPLPAVAHVVREQWNHFIVLHKVTSDMCLVGDPAQGLHKISREKFIAEWTGVVVTFKVEGTVSGPTASSALSFLRRVIEPYDFVLAEILLANIVLMSLTLGGSLYLRLIVDRVLDRHDGSLVTCMGWTLFGLFACRSAFGILRSLLVAHTARRLDGSLLRTYLHQIIHLPLTFFQSCDSGDILSRIGDIFRVRDLVSGVTLGLIIDASSVLLSFVALALFNWRLGFMAISVLVPIIAVLSSVIAPLKRRQRQALEAGSQLQSIFVESVAGITTMKSLVAEGPFLGRAEDKIGDFVERLYGINLLGSLSGGTAEFVVGVTTSFVVWQALKSSVSGAISVGTFVAFFSIFYGLLQPLMRVMSSTVTFGEAFASLDRLNDVMDLAVEEQSPAALTFAPLQDISFCDVKFSYGCRAPVLKSIQLNIPVGAVTAIVGESGGGKTTIARLLLRHFEPTSGNIMIDGTDLSTFSSDSIRRKIGYVEQETYLFQGTLLQNLLLGCEQVTPQQIQQVLEDLNLTPFIQELPQGLQTMVGERGISLSGGQRQRIGIARALLRQPSILILDEASSHLDAHNDVSLHRIIEHRRGLCTIIVITHRLMSVQRADLICFIKNGTVTEHGTHEELLRNRNTYAQYWSQQMDFTQREYLPQDCIMTKIPTLDIAV